MDSGRPQDAGHRVLRILLLEDDAEDAALVERALASAGFAYALRRVASEAGFRSEIAAAPDLIVSDYQLPGYTGLDALALARERFPQIPFILVSGRLGETLRRQALEQGAAAVLSKRQLERLPEAIRAALRMSTVRERARAARGSLPADGQEIRDAFEHAAAALALAALDGRWLRANRAFCALTGYSEEELRGRDCHAITHPEDVPGEVEALSRLVAEEIPVCQRDQRYIRKDGRPVWVQVTASLVRGNDGAPLYRVVQVLDITARRQAEARFRALFEHAAVGIAHTTPEGRILEANPKLCEMLGYAREDLVGRTTRELTHPGDRDRQDALREELIAGRRAHFGGEKRYLRRDGTPVWLNRTVTLAHDASSGTPYLVQVFEDITEQKRAEAQLARANRARCVLLECSRAHVRARSETELLDGLCRAIVETGGYRQGWIGLATGDPEKPLRVAAQAGYREDRPYLPAAGTDRRSYRGVALTALASGEIAVARDLLNDPRPEAEWARERARRHGFQSSIALPLAAQGKRLGVLVVHAPEPDAFDEQEVALLRGLADDIAFGITAIRTRIARERAEGALLESERRFREIFDQAAVGITRVDLDGVLLEVNQKFCDMLGYTRAELIGRHIRDITHPEDFGQGERFRVRIASGSVRSQSGEKRFVRKDGEIVWARRTMSAARDAQGRIRYVISVVEDINEQKRAALELERKNALTRLLEALARAANEAASPEAAMRASLERICEHGGWKLARLGLYGAGAGDRLPERSFWHTAEPSRFEAFMRASLDPRHFLVGGRFVSLVLKEKRPVWLADIAPLGGSGRLQLALECGLRSAFAFPVIVGGEVAAFLEFFAEEPREPDALLLEAVTSVGAQLARLIERARATAAAAQLAAIVESSPDAVISVAPDGTILTWNPGAERLLGYSAAEALGADVGMLVPEERREEAAAIREAALSGRQVAALDTERLAKGGRRIAVSVSAAPLRAEGGVSGFALIYRDITERKRTEDALREAEEQFRQLANNIPQVFWISDVEQKHTIYISPAVERLIGRSAEELRRRPRLLVRAVHAEDRARVHAARKAAIAGGYDESYRIVRPDGSVRWVRDRAFPVRDASGRVYRIAGIAEDVTERKLAEERLLHLAHYDVLTSLPNRVLFYDRLKQALAQAKRNQWVTGVMFLDVDRFKNVNDTLGHAVGDRLLQQVSERLLGAVRSGDTVGRLGGDEFAIVLSNLSSAQDANMVAQKIMNVFAKPFDLEGAEIYVTVSIGITLYPYDSTDQDTLIRNADAAMYRAKETGRSCYQFYRPEMNARALELLGLESSLRRALERGEFLLYYQPKANVSDGSIVGVEALIRWRHPERGMVAPSEFIPVLEETGLIVRVGEWVLEAVCEQINAWKSQGIAPPPVAVNLSARQFSARDFGARVRRILNEHGVEPRLLELEITESSIMANAEEAARTLEELAGLGVGLSIDDFGTGYSSLGYLKRFPLDGLKIDRSFVRDITHDGDDATITRAVISMAHSLGLKVIAEGVETEEQLAFLAEYGCDQVQGYYFARPLAPEECGQWLREGRRMRRPYAGTETGAPTLLLVDDDEDALALLKRTLARDGYRILLARNAAEAFAVLDSHRVDVVISDHKMPGMSGTDFLQRVKVSHPRAIRMMTSGYDDFRMVAEAVNKGEVARFLPKSLSEEELRASVSEALRARSPSPSAA